MESKEQALALARAKRLRAEAESAAATEREGSVKVFGPELLDRAKKDFGGAKASAMESLRTIIPGVKQAYGHFFDPEMEQAEGQKINAIQEEYAPAKAQTNSLFRGVGAASPMLVGGGVVGGVAKALEKLGVALPSILPAAANSTAVNRTLTATGTGAAGGAATHLARPIGDPNEERMSGFGLPVALSALIPGLMTGTSEARRTIKNLSTPENAAEAAILKGTGASPSTRASSALTAAQRKAKAQVDSIQGDWKNRINTIERDVRHPPVLMENSSGLQADTLPDEVRQMMAGRMEKAVKRGSTDVSQILDANGVPITSPNTQTLQDARETLRMLRAASRRTTDPNAEQGYNRVAEAVQKDIDNWAKLTPETEATSKSLKALDTEYATDILPLIAPKKKGAPVGAWRGGDSDTWSEKDLNRVAGGTDQGQELGQLFDQVPDAAKDLRQYMGTQLQAGGVKPQVFDPSTRRDVLFPGQDPERLTTIAAQLRRGTEEGILPTFQRALERTPIIGRPFEKLRRGVPNEVLIPEKNRRILADLLRGSAITTGTNEGY